MENFLILFSFILSCELTSWILGFGDIQFSDVRQKTYVKHIIVRTVTTGDLLKCLRYCVLQNGCLSVNINKSEKKCNLLQFSMNDNECIGNVVQSNNWIYYGGNIVSFIEKCLRIAREEKQICFYYRKNIFYRTLFIL